MIKKPKKVKLPKTLASHTVCNSKGEHCAVGYLLHKAGVSNKVLRTISWEKPFIYNEEEYCGYKDLFVAIYGLRSFPSDIIYNNDTSKTDFQRVNYLKDVLNKLNIKYYGEEDVKET